MLTQLSLWWFEQLAGTVENHVVSTDVPEQVAGRAMVVTRLDMFPVECIARGYLTGSGLAEYRESGTVTGLPLSDKSKVTAGLLQILLGTFGVGRFYLGYTTIGVLQLVVSLVTCGIGAIWPLIDGIMILMGNVPDPQGRKLRD